MCAIFALICSAFLVNVETRLLHHGDIMDSVCANYTMLSWNVRGLNNPAKQEDVKHLINIYKPELVSLQETKLVVIDQQAICNFLGASYENSFCFIPAEGTRGGILLATRDSSLLLHHAVLTSNTLTATVTNVRNNAQWTVTGVYGPQGDME